MEESIRFQHFEVLRRDDGMPHELGRGAMGVTYKAFDTNLQCHVALKVISPAYLDSELARQRFLREARAAAAIRHPNVATVFHLGSEGDTWFYAMEFVDGETVEQMMRRDGAVPAQKALRIADQVARALGAAEKQGLVHRDIKPSNLMIVHEDAGDFAVKVIDFGLAKSAGGESGLDAATLTTGGFLGTPHFASPEQLDERTLDVRSDIYSLGVTLYYMLAGTTPFSGSLAQVMSQHLHRDPPLDRLFGQPPAVIDLLRKMLQKDPALRPQTPTDLRRAIDDCLARITDANTLTSVAGTVFPVSSDTLMETAVSDEPPAASGDPAPGMVLAGRFELLDEFPVGQYGRTFRARNLESGDVVAVLILNAAMLPTSNAYTRLEHEITALQSVRHPTVVRVDSVEHTENCTFVTREWIDGPSLSDHLRRRRIDPTASLAILGQLAGGMDAVQASGVPCPELSINWITALPRETGICPKFNPINLSMVAPARPDRDPAGHPRRGPDPDGIGRFARELGELSIEMLGGTRSVAGADDFLPVPGLPEEANAILQKAVAGGFASAGVFYEALAAAMDAFDNRTPHPAAPPIRKRPPWLGIALLAVLLIAAAATVAVWWNSGGGFSSDGRATDAEWLELPPPPVAVSEPTPSEPVPIATPEFKPEPTPAIAPSELAIREALTRADERAVAGDYAVALADLVELGRLHPQDPRPGEKLENVAAKLRTESEVLPADQFAALEDSLRAAAQAGSPSSQMLLARALDGTNDGEAFKFFLLAAESGNSEAMLEVGNRYASGRGVDRSLELAFPWFQRAARKGEPRALYSVGECYYFGAGVERNVNQAIYFLTQAAAFDDVYAKGLLGNIYRKGDGLDRPNYAEAFRLLSEAAAQGYLDAQGNLGVMIANGEVIDGKPVDGKPDPEKADQAAALALFREGAAQGNALCTFLYAQCLGAGVGADKPDPRAAREQYIRAAELGNSAAQEWCKRNRVKFTVPGR